MKNTEGESLVRFHVMHGTWYVDVTAIINLSVTSQLERADFVAAKIDRHRKHYTDSNDCGEGYLAIQTPMDGVQYKLRNETCSFQTVQ